MVSQLLIVKLLSDLLSDLLSNLLADTSGVDLRVIWESPGVMLLFMRSAEAMWQRA